MATFTHEDRTALTDGVRRLLADLATEGDVRRTMETARGYDPALWRRLAEMGVVGLTIAEDYGGGGGGPVELERVMEETGAVLLCGPLLSGVLAAGLLQAIDDDAARARLLPAIADGSRIATAALTGDAGGWTPDTVAARALDVDGTWTVSGVSSFVTHGQIADTLLVAAHTAQGIALFEVDAGAQGMVATALPAFDRTSPLARVTFAQTPARALAGGRPAWDAVERALDLARVGLAGEQAGGARRVLDVTVAYAKTLAQGAADAGAAVSLAAFACADAFVTLAATSIQMHGGVAFTWAHPAHLYLRRARADAQLFGAPAYYRERYLRQLGA
jgi:alkylation response protein AidB-like acyl-CoA dehydrogenase